MIIIMLFIPLSPLDRWLKDDTREKNKKIKFYLNLDLLPECLLCGKVISS